MRKKFKYVKVLISIILMCSMIFPSYATLTSSDGSFFVTKAEFDSFAGEINSRLMAFEAGINTKIDSQVTSYLDRNGIWSGKSVASNTIVVSKWTDTNILNMIKNASYNEIVADCNGGNPILVANQSPKSGLAFLSIKTCEAWDCSNQREDTYQDMGGGGDLLFELLENDMLVSSCMIGKFTGFGWKSYSKNWCYGYHSFSVPTATYTLLGFVSKNTKLEVDVRAVFTFSFGATSRSMYGTKKYGVDGQTVLLKDFKIY